VALYPREGTFLHDHPFAVPNAPWVTDQQRSAAKVFTDFVRTATVQARVMENGFRPVNTAVKLAEPISAAFGVDPNQPRTFLSVPDPGVLNEVQLSWKVVKKQSDITFLIDTSASMADDDKLDHAKKALLRVVAELPAEINVSLAEFNDAVVELVPLGNVGRNRKELLRKITALESNNATSLYDSVFSSVEALHGRGDDSRMRAVVLLSDGADTASLHKIKDVLDQLKRIREVANSPVMIVPIAYGDDADLKELESIANASGRSVVQGDPKNIADLLLTLSKGF
jgi:Ca-activated chloride channel family protein